MLYVVRSNIPHSSGGHLFNSRVMLCSVDWRLLIMLLVTTGLATPSSSTSRSSSFNCRNSCSMRACSLRNWLHLSLVSGICSCSFPELSLALLYTMLATRQFTITTFLAYASASITTVFYLFNLAFWRNCGKLCQTGSSTSNNAQFEQ